MGHAVTYELIRRDAASGARLGRVSTPHGAFDTPAFMPVGTQGTIKGLTPASVAAAGAQVILGNTYHLMLRPGSDLVAEMGGLHRWMGWNGPILTDSGGFQVFSLADVNRIDEQGVRFKSHIDGTSIELTPERSMRVQQELGSDIIMAFDDCPPAAGPDDAATDEASINATPSAGSARGPLRHAVGHADYADRLRLANERTLRWLQRCIKAHRDSGRWSRQGLFGIVQGGTDLDQRSWCASRVAQHDLPGFAIGGVAVGESPELMARVVAHTAGLLPADRPRYLMGVGYERDIVQAVRAGVDMFDCVLPTRNGRNAVAFTPTGPIRLKNARFARDPMPLDGDCDCPACGGGAGVWAPPLGGPRQGAAASAGVGAVSKLSGGASGGASGGVSGGAISRSYLRHLFQVNEMLGGILVSLHNLRHFQRLLLDIRQAIRDNDWSCPARRWPVAFDPGEGR